MPGVDVLGRNPTVSQAVSNVQNQALQVSRPRHDALGDTTPLIPLLPSEGYHGSKGKKPTIYDDLTLPQWAVGQLTNVHQIPYSVLLMQLLLQVIFVLRNATSFP